MVLMNAKEFAAASGFPVGMVRRYCRQGLLPHWKMGTRYLLEYDSALAAMMDCREKPPVKVFNAAVSPFFESVLPTRSSRPGISFKERLKSL